MIATAGNCYQVQRRPKKVPGADDSSGVVAIRDCKQLHRVAPVNVCVGS